MEYLTELGYIGLFLAAFLAATILPLSSEVVVLSLITAGASPVYVVAIASVGNILGSVVNYYLGYGVSLGLQNGWFKVEPAKLLAAQDKFRRYGIWSLCFAWVPIIGDPLTAVAGMLRVNFSLFLVLVGAGKILRYSIIAYFVV